MLPVAEAFVKGLQLSVRVHAGSLGFLLLYLPDEGQVIVKQAPLARELLLQIATRHCTAIPDLLSSMYSYLSMHGVYCCSSRGMNALSLWGLCQQKYIMEVSSALLRLLQCRCECKQWLRHGWGIPANLATFRLTCTLISSTAVLVQGLHQQSKLMT